MWRAIDLSSLSTQRYSLRVPEGLMHRTPRSPLILVGLTGNIIVFSLIKVDASYCLMAVRVMNHLPGFFFLTLS
ncbi:hypothetical protein GYMLUDRAFT_890879 [Collybiopsis luxurians FD-317 M1]|uniref:Uncharacterized protein n=1 Tax=Collybiopsis luxurians FD-317 M1 TaxID=944289 RepID=A0A0D0CIH6_9AGAR|nr:hypothetical protein GYMLUDRAFT_890879 [Collybiopsis luxurians FD-317 M1]